MPPASTKAPAPVAAPAPTPTPVAPAVAPRPVPAATPAAAPPKGTSQLAALLARASLPKPEAAAPASAPAPAAAPTAAAPTVVPIDAAVAARAARVTAPMGAAREAVAARGPDADAEELAGEDLIEESASTPSRGVAAGAAPEPRASFEVEVEGPPRPAARTSIRPWYEEYFDDNHLATLADVTPARTRREAAFAAESLALPEGGEVLDVGCGHGRHAVEMATRGYRVVGVDLALGYLVRAADEAQRRGVPVNFVHGDMRSLAFRSQFDGAYCLGGTFGYFDEDGNRRTLDSARHALRPGGRLLLEAPNRDCVAHDLPSRGWSEGHGCMVLDEVDFGFFTSRVEIQRSIVFDDGRQATAELSIRLYSLHELERLLGQAGFRVVEVSGDVTTRGRFFGADSRSLLVLAEKPR